MSRKLKKDNSGVFGSSESIFKNKSFSLWRPRSLANLVPNKDKDQAPVLNSTQDSKFKGSSFSLVPREYKLKKVENRVKDILDGWSISVEIVLVEVKGLPAPPIDGSAHEVYCKFRLGSETHKSKSIPHTKNLEWRERFHLHLHKDTNLQICVSDKGKLKTYMGSCNLDLAAYEKDKTHDIWANLNDGYGFIHLSVTMCTLKNTPDVVPDYESFAFDSSNTNGVSRSVKPFNRSISQTSGTSETSKEFNTNCNAVGELRVKLVGAKGLPGKPCAYAVLEVDNERVQTHTDRAAAQPAWNKSYVFKVYDVASILEIKVYDKTINPLKEEALGRVSIPLLRVHNNQMRWYALKDRTNRVVARGNCPRVQVQMSLEWNPVAAVMRFFEPKTVKYIKAPPKFNMSLAYGNVEFTRDVFDTLQEINRQYKNLFEWENTEVSFVALIIWIIFWQTIRVWMIPGLMLLPFLYYGLSQHKYTNKMQSTIECLRTLDKIEEALDLDTMSVKIFGSLQRLNENKGITKKIYSIQETTLKVSNGVDFIASLTERIYNLVTFKIPVLSYTAMMVLFITTVIMYFVPLHILLIFVGIYKFLRKFLNPKRKPNNDLLDFILRIPDSEMLKDWKELPVPEPNQTNSEK